MGLFLPRWCEAVWEKIIETVSTYGPFPFGMVLGAWITHKAYQKALDLTKQEMKAHADEKRALIDMNKANMERIDKLHGELYGKNKGRKP